MAALVQIQTLCTVLAADADVGVCGAFQCDDGVQSYQVLAAEAHGGIGAACHVVEAGVGGHVHDVQSVFLVSHLPEDRAVGGGIVGRAPASEELFAFEHAVHVLLRIGYDLCLFATLFVGHRFGLGVLQTGLDAIVAVGQCVGHVAGFQYGLVGVLDELSLILVVLDGGSWSIGVAAVHNVVCVVDGLCKCLYGSGVVVTGLRAGHEGVAVLLVGVQDTSQFGQCSCLFGHLLHLDREVTGTSKVVRSFDSSWCKLDGVNLFIVSLIYPRNVLDIIHRGTGYRFSVAQYYFQTTIILIPVVCAVEIEFNGG